MAKKKENNQEQANLFQIDSANPEENKKKRPSQSKKMTVKETSIQEVLEEGHKGETLQKGKVSRKNQETGSRLSKAGPKSPKGVKSEPQKTSSDNQGDHFSRFSDYDVHLFREGKHYSLHEKFGSHIMEHKGTKGTYFAVWAPNASQVTVIGEFNAWNRGSHPMNVRLDQSGIWECFIPEVGQGTIYKYFIQSNHHGYSIEKADPFAIHAENPPKTASIVWNREISWTDRKWMDNRKTKIGKSQPVSVYELHFGSWRRVPEDGDRSLSYTEMANQLSQYIKEMGYTHVEFMPVMEHPFYGSWGYQLTGYFAPSSRYGTPQEFAYLIDKLHKEGIGVILDWVPSHFPTDAHGLGYFDGTHLFEHADERKGFHPDWKSFIFNYGRNEVRSFLISNALYWLDKYHIDGLRVDAVASMLYLDYSRKEGEWIPNEHGGRENLEAIEFLKEFNIAVGAVYPDVLTIAEESTAWPMVSKPTYVGGLGFDMKWMMGWMHDTLDYFAKESVFRSHHQGQITFSIIYAFTENFMLPLSHDEVVHGKGSMINKMPGDEWQKFANLRLLYSYMYAHPGAKLMFMGGEFGQEKEWNHDKSLQWHLLNHDSLNKGLQQAVKSLNNVYKQEPALYEVQFDGEGFEWVDMNDSANSVISFLRKGKSPKEIILVVCNFTPIVRENYRIGVPKNGDWMEIFNSDSRNFGGSGVENETMEASPIPYHGKDFSITVALPPLGVSYFKLLKVQNKSED
ncbi:MAG: 1,4-alpha-glucan branching protein GlgB [Bacteroidota bacterium]|nr:1,4-alpha-glucan branching protein GlgB [Bacteroidota bacterium]